MPWQGRDRLVAVVVAVGVGIVVVLVVVVECPSSRSTPDRRGANWVERCRRA